MNKHQLFEEVLLKVSDAMTTSRLGLRDGKIAEEDLVDVIKEAKVALQLLEVAAAKGMEEMTDDEQNELDAQRYRIVMG